jgi:hypothetical protein
MLSQFITREAFAHFQNRLLLKSNLAGWYLCNLGSEHGIAHLPMRSRKSVAVTSSVLVPTNFLSLHSGSFFTVQLPLVLESPGAQFFHRMWLRYRKFHLARQQLCCWVSRFEQLISGIYFDTCPALAYTNSRLILLIRTSRPNDTRSAAPWHTGGAHPCRSHSRLHSY